MKAAEMKYILRRNGVLLLATFIREIPTGPRSRSRIIKYIGKAPRLTFPMIYVSLITRGCFIILRPRQHIRHFTNDSLKLCCVKTILLWFKSRYNDVIMSAMASQTTNLTIVYSTVYSVADQRKHQSSASLTFVRGIHRLPVNSPLKGQ